MQCLGDGGRRGASPDKGEAVPRPYARANANRIIDATIRILCAGMVNDPVDHP